MGRTEGEAQQSRGRQILARNLLSEGTDWSSKDVTGRWFRGSHEKRGMFKSHVCTAEHVSGWVLILQSD